MKSWLATKEIAMPDLHPDAFPDNAPGKYYIDKTCID